MQLQKTIRIIIQQLHEALEDLPTSLYIQPSSMLSGATIGQHVRHIIELFIALEEGYLSGTVNYEKRKRDILIETNKNFACELLTGIAHSIDKPQKDLLLDGNYDMQSDSTIHLSTNYNRELLFNLEHAIHHMALIRVGFIELTTIRLPDTFGVAPSTTKHKLLCAQ